MKSDGEGLRRSIRLRPTMYIGSMGTYGLQSLLEPWLLLGFVGRGEGCVQDVSVDLRADGSCRIAFEGWPGSAPFEEKSFEDLARWLTFDGYDVEARPPQKAIPIGLLRQGPGVDLGLVNALCSSLEVVAWGGGRTGRLRFHEGLREQGSLVLESSPSTPGSGLCVTLMPDATLFDPPRRFPARFILERMSDLSALETGNGWCLRDEVSGVETRLRRPRGLTDLCEDLSEQQGFLHQPWSFEGQVGQTRVRLALQWCSYQHQVMRSWVNLRRSHEGGTHLQGFRLGLRKALRARLNARAPRQEVSLPSDEEMEKHLTVVLDLRMPEPVWHGPSNTKLTNPETKSEVAWLVAGWLEKALADDSAMEDRVLSTLSLLKKIRPDPE